MIGWLHMIFLITGDILTVYALIGLVLLAMRKVKDKTALIVVVAIYGYLLITLGSSVLFLDTSAIIDPASALVAARETTANLAGSFGDVIGEHLKALLPKIQLICFPIGLAGGLLLRLNRRHRQHSRRTGQCDDRTVPRGGVCRDLAADPAH